MMRPSVVALLALALVTAPSITPAVAAPADGPSYVIGVSGMTWGVSCTKRVRETLQGLENVAKVEVDFARKTAVVAMKEGATLSKDVAVAALEEKGFQVTSFEARKPRGEAVYIATVGGMTWGVGCTKRVRETLLTLENVAAVEVDFAKKTAAITMKGGASLAKDTVVSALKAKNYEVTAFECREPRAEAVFIAGIGGMKWAQSCAKRVRETLAGLANVATAEVDFEKKVALVTMKNGADLDRSLVEKTLDGINFQLTSFSRRE